MGVKSGLTRVNVMLEQEMLNELDKTAQKQGVSRSAMLREAIAQLLRGRRSEPGQLAQPASLFPDAPIRRMTPEEVVEAIEKAAEELAGWDGMAELFRWRRRHES